MTAVNTAPGTSLAPLFAREKVQATLAPFLTDGVTYERMVAAVQLAAAKTPAIAQCTTASIITAVGQALRSGLEIGDTAHLVPFGRELTFIADYKGIAQLLVASGAVRHVELRVVREGDDFEYEYGLDARLRHVPSADSKAPITHAYVVFRLPFNRSAFDVMSIAEIDAIRQKYSKHWKAGPVPGWYAKKTVLRQAAKTLPKSEKLMRALRAIEADAEAEFGEPAAPIAMGQPRDDDDAIPEAVISPVEPAADDGELFQDDRDLDGDQ
jgi:recombination protein RecT